MQYLEVPLELRVGKVVDLEHVLLFSIFIFLYQHHGVNERVHSRQLGIWRSQETKKEQFAFLSPSRAQRKQEAELKCGLAALNLPMFVIYSQGES